MKERLNGGEMLPLSSMLRAERVARGPLESAVLARFGHLSSMLSLALLRPSSRLRASVVATATAEPFPPQRFGPDRPLELGGCACAVASGSAGGELLRLRGLFDAGTLDALLAAARSSMHFETDADTVDGSATYHASIVEAGAPVDATLAALLAPVLETRLLPYLRAQYACPGIMVADALVRRYRPEERPALSTHYDVSACATVIVPLVEASEYGGGLYVQGGAGVGSRRLVGLERGDVLLHQWDVMHGVHVTSGERYSLVLWCSESSDSNPNPHPSPSPGPNPSPNPNPGPSPNPNPDRALGSTSSSRTLRAMCPPARPSPR